MPQVRGSGRQMNRLRERYQKEVAPALKKEFGYTQRDGDPQAREDRRQHGSGRGDVERQARRCRRRRAGTDHRAEGGRPPRHEVDRAVQAAPGHAGRCDGHAARRADVRVPRSPDQHRAAARARLPRCVAEGVRWPRQLHDGSAGSAAVPGDRLHEGGQGARHERVGGHQRADRRGSTQAPAVDGHAVQNELRMGSIRIDGSERWQRQPRSPRN